MRQLFLLGTFAPLLVAADPLTIYENFMLNPSCSSPTGYIDITVLGGTPPYTYAWSNFTTDEDATDLPAGYIEVTVTDAMSAQATQGWTLVATPLSGGYNAQDGHASCIGQSGGEVQVIEWGTNGVPPYTYDPAPAGVDPQGDPYFYFPGVPFGTQVSINVTDANACTGVVYETVVGPQPTGGPFMVLQSALGSCSGGSGGSATITNVYDGIWFQGPDAALFDASDNLVTGYQNVSSNTITFTGLAPGHYYASRNWDPQGYLMAFPCEPNDTLGFDIPDLGVACGTVSGDVFIDNNDDCAQGGGEVGVPELVLQIEPGGTYAITDANGHYSLDLGDGSYTLTQNDASLIQLCPVVAPVPFTMASNAQIIDLADSSTVPLDLQAMISGTAAHPGFALSYALKAKNLSPQVSGPVTIQMNFDPQIQYVNASIVPTTITSSMLSWDLSAMPAYAQYNITVQFLVPPGVPLGTQLISSVVVTNTLPDDQSSNNSATVITTVTGSFDPNEKVVQPADIYFLDLDDHLDYTIRFQNTGTDTAYTVVITDTLSADLDMGSFQNGASSHPCTVDFLGGRVVRWTFANIFLPDSNTNEAASQGFVGFSLKPASDFPGGEYIDNASDIFFDFNDPVHTNTASVLAEFSVGMARVPKQDRLTVFPNPASDRITLRRAAATRAFVQVCALDGRPVTSASFVAAEFSMDVRTLPAGVYSISVRDPNGSVTCRFLKQ